MKIMAYYRSNESRTNDRVTHFGKALGARFSTRERPEECDLAIQCGFQISPAMKDAMERGTPIIILENPVWHYGDKMETYIYGYNGLNGLSTGGVVDSLPPRPHPELGEMVPRGEEVWVIGQIVSDKAVRGADIRAWYREMGRKHPTAQFREHPGMIDRRFVPPAEPLEEMFDRSALIVTYTSTVGAEALIYGVPTYVEHPGGWAYGVEDREEWIHMLSWRHWSITDSIDVDTILSGYDRAKADAEAGNYDNMSNGRAQP